MQISPKVMQTSPKVSILQHALNQRSLAEGKGKGAAALSPGQHPGYKIAFSNAPCKGKSFNHSKNKQ